MTSGNVRRLFQDRRAQGFLFFLVFVLAGHVVLPAMDETELYPFSTWQLFDGTPCTRCYYDIQIYVGSERMMLSDYKSINDKYKYNYMAQKIGQIECYDKKATEFLKKSLLAQGVRPINILVITKYISEYVVLTPEEKLSAVELVCPL